MYDVLSRIPKLNSFIYCASLRTGCFIIGWHAVVQSIWIYVVLLIGVIHTPPGGKDDPYPAIVEEFIHASLMDQIVCVIFLIGLYKSKAVYLLPGIFLSVIEILDFIMVGLMLFCTHHPFHYFEYSFGPEGAVLEHRFITPTLVSFISYVVVGMLDVYAFLVMFSYFNVLREGHAISILDQVDQEEV